MPERNGIAVDVELHPSTTEYPDAVLVSGSIAVTVGGERYGIRLSAVSADDATAALEAFGAEMRKLLRGEPHGLGGGAPQWRPGERELAERIVFGMPDDAEGEDDGEPCDPA